MKTHSFRDYVSYAERYLHWAEKRESSEDIDWLLIPVIILAWTAVESFVNNRLDDYISLPESIFQLHERALLSETRLKFVDSGDNAGTFTLEGTEYRRLEDKIFFLIAKFSSQPQKDIKKNQIWQQFQSFKQLRDSLVHPRTRKEINLDIQIAGSCLDIAKQIIQLLSEYLWGKKVEF